MTTGPTCERCQRSNPARPLDMRLERMSDRIVKTLREIGEGIPVGFGKILDVIAETPFWLITIYGLAAVVFLATR